MQANYVRVLAQHMLNKHRQNNGEARGPTLDTTLPEASQGPQSAKAGAEARGSEVSSQEKSAEGPEEEEGFTRSVSIYYSWLQGQRAAARIGRGAARSNAALILQCEHWLEAADPKHRYGTNLRPYFDHWLGQQPSSSGEYAQQATSTPPLPPSLGASGSKGAARARLHVNGGAEAGVSGRQGAERCDAVLEDAGVGGPNAGSEAGTSPLVGSSTTPRRTCSAPALQDLQNGPPASQSTTKPPPLPRPPGLCLVDTADEAAAREQPASAAHHHFFHWLDVGPGRHVDLESRGVPRTKLESERVTYLSPEERDQLEVTVERSKGLLVFRSSGALVHTGSELALAHTAPSALPLPAPPAAAGDTGAGQQAPGVAVSACCSGAPAAAADAVVGGSGVCVAGGGDAGDRECLAAGAGPESALAAAARGAALLGAGLGVVQVKEKPCKWIYVLDTNGRLYVHAKYRGRFHHSSFLQGGAVLSAGGIVVEHGRILKLTADSGHYRPNFESFMGTVQLLKDWGADLSATKLSAKHIKCPELPSVDDRASLVAQQQQQRHSAGA